LLAEQRLVELLFRREMDTFLPYLYLWLVQAGVAGVIAMPVYLRWRERVQWRSWEMIDLILPWAVWMALMLTDLAAKSLGNLGETAVVGLAIALGVVTRAVIGTRVRQPMAGRVMLIALCIVAAGIYFLMPVWPE
jgi:hypothetical protein